MAAHVDSFWQQFREYLALLRPFPGRLEFSSRLALACALTTLVVEIYQTPDPALTAYVAFFVMKRDRMESVIISIVLAILISLLVGTLILVAMAVIDQPLVAEKKSFPPRLVMMLLLTMLALAATSFHIVLASMWDHVSPNDPKKVLAQELNDNLRGKLERRLQRRMGLE